MGDVTHRKRELRFEKKQSVEFLPPNERVDIQSWARPDDFMRYGRCALVGLRADDVKAVSIERLRLSLSPHVKKPLNSKRWIKDSYLNQFRVFGFLYMFMNILWTLCLFHISVYYGYATYLIRIILFAINHLLTNSLMFSSTAMYH